MKGLILFFIILSCSRNPDNVDPTETAVISTKSSAIQKSRNICLVNTNPEAFQGCCSWNGGPKDCGLGAFEFTPDKRLVCRDNTISSTCIGT